MFKTFYNPSLELPYQGSSNEGLLHVYCTNPINCSRGIAFYQRAHIVESTGRHYSGSKEK